MPVRAAMDWYKLGPERLVVLCDDLELPVGRIRVRPKGSDGGHNGLKSVIAHAGTADFARVRIGIGRPADPAYQVVDWVLGRFSADEAALVRGAAENAAKAALDVIGNGAEHAMNLYNGKR